MSRQYTLVHKCAFEGHEATPPILVAEQVDDSFLFTHTTIRWGLGRKWLPVFSSGSALFGVYNHSGVHA